MSAEKTAITPTRAEDFPEWYQQVIKAADLAENSETRGCILLRQSSHWPTRISSASASFSDA